MSCTLEQIGLLSFLQDNSICRFLELLRELFEHQPVRSKCERQHSYKGETKSQSEVTKVESGESLSIVTKRNRTNDFLLMDGGAVRRN